MVPLHPEGGPFGEGLLGAEVGNVDHRGGGTRIPDESDRFKGLHAEFGGEVGAEDAFPEGGDRQRGHEAPHDPSQGHPPVGRCGILHQRGEHLALFAGRTRAEGFEVASVLAVVAAGDLDEGFNHLGGGGLIAEVKGDLAPHRRGGIGGQLGGQSRKVGITGAAQGTKGGDAGLRIGVAGQLGHDPGPLVSQPGE